MPSSGTHTEPAPRLSIIGRDYQIIDALAKMIHKVVSREHDHTELRHTLDMRGRRFDVMLENGRVARVTVELDHVESAALPAVDTPPTEGEPSHD